MATKIDQKAYLQKYLSGPSKEKKKKKKKVVKGSGFKIVDDDIDLTKLRPLDGDELDILDGGEDAPQIAGIIDERPEELKKMEQFKTSSKWRVINEDDGFNSKLQIQEIKKDIKEVEKENEVIFGKMYSDSEDEQQKNGSDLSPPRKNSKKHDHNSDFSPPRQQKSPKSDKKYDSDISPPRRKETQKERVRKPSRWGDADPEPSTQSSTSRNSSKSHQKYDYSKRRPQNEDSDASPPRKRKSSHQKNRSRKRSPSSDLSPPRKERNGSRKDKHSERKLKEKTEQNSKRKKYYSDSDISPPRKDRKDKEDRSRRIDKRRSPSPNIRRQGSDSDLSPPRKNKISKDNRSARSPQNSKRKNESDSDLSPPRKDKDRRNIDSPPPSNKKMAKTLEGKKAGLQDARQLRQENEEFRRKEDDVFRKLGDSVSGRNAKAVSRKAKRETSAERQKQKEKAERQKELDAKYKVWSKGIKQVQDQEARVQDFLHEASKPLARHKGDKDLENNLKQIERAGDPMLQYIREKKRERGELPPEKPSYKGSFPPNRFNIRPGYRWDGVDRSNGYEKKFFEQQSKRKALEEEAYKWSTEDL